MTAFTPHLQDERRRRGGRSPADRARRMLALAVAVAITAEIVQRTCTWTRGADYSTTKGLETLHGVDSKEACCAKCFEESNCRAGVWQDNSERAFPNGSTIPDACYLKGGVVAPIHTGKKNLVGCLARPNSPPPPMPPVPCFNTVGQPCTIEFNASDTSHVFSGFGADIVYPANMSGLAGFQPLHLRYLRVAVGTSKGWHDDMHALRAVTEPLGIEWVMTMWSAKKGMAGVDAHNRLTAAGVEFFVSYWLKLVTGMCATGICPHHLDLMNEPDSAGAWSLGIAPPIYNSLAKAVRQKLDGVGLHNVSVTGPGLAFLNSSSGNTKYLDALDSEAVAALGAFSSHAWDDGAYCHGGASCTLHQWPDLAVAAAKVGPDKPIWIEEYATKEFDLHCATGICTYPSPDITGGFSSAFTMAYASRTVQNTLALLNAGANAAFYWQVQDDYKSWGWVTAAGVRKPIWSALVNLFPKVPIGSTVIKSLQHPEKGCTPGADGKDICPEGLYGSLFHNPGGGPLRLPQSIVFAAANDANSSRTATILIHSLPGVVAKAQVREAVGCVLERRGNPDPEVGTMDHAKLLNVTVVLAMHHDGLSFEVTMPADSTLTVVLDLLAARLRI